MTIKIPDMTSKYQTWTPWIDEYIRLATHGHSNRRAAQMADTLIEAKIAAMQRAISSAK